MKNEQSEEVKRFSEGKHVFIFSFLFVILRSAQHMVYGATGKRLPLCAAI